MNNVAILLPLFYLLFLLGLFIFLLIRGVTHSFLALFLVGTLLELVPHLGFLLLQEMPGGPSAHAGYFPLLTIFGTFGTLCWAVGFFLLAKYLLGTKTVA